MSGRRRQLAGDFHCHTVLSHDVWGGPGRRQHRPRGGLHARAARRASRSRNAELRGLDFLAITDHNRIDALAPARVPLRPAHAAARPTSTRCRSGHAGVFVPDRRDASATSSATPTAPPASPASPARGRFLDARARARRDRRPQPPVLRQRGPGRGARLGLRARGLAAASTPSRSGTSAGRPATTCIPFADSDNYLSLPWWESEIVSRPPRARRSAAATATGASTSALNRSEQPAHLSRRLVGEQQPRTMSAPARHPR